MNAPTTKARSTPAAPTRRVARSAALPRGCPALPTSATPAENCVGVVTGVGADAMVVTSGRMQANAKRAASCLMLPQVGDTVACLMVAPNELWVLAVLEREVASGCILQTPANTRLEAASGRLTFGAQELHLETESLVARSLEADLVVERGRVTGSELRVVGSVVKIVGSVLSTVFDRVSHFSKNHLRTTDGLDRVQAMHLDCEASQLLRLSGEHALINGEKLIKARGGQIHFG